MVMVFVLKICLLLALLIGQTLVVANFSGFFVVPVVKEESCAVQLALGQIAPRCAFPNRIRMRVLAPIGRVTKVSSGRMGQYWACWLE